MSVNIVNTGARNGAITAILDKNNECTNCFWLKSSCEKGIARLGGDRQDTTICKDSISCDEMLEILGGAFKKSSTSPERVILNWEE